MNQFMVEISLPAYMSNELIAIIPQQRKLVNKLFQQGIITNYSLALDRSKIWVVFNCANMFEVGEYLNKFPIRSHVDFFVQELAFSEQIDFSITTMSLN
jgi:hypothetical protein